MDQGSMVETNREIGAATMVERNGTEIGPIESEVLRANREIDIQNSVNPFKEENTIKVFLAEPSAGSIDVLAEDNRKDFAFELSHLQRNSKFRFFSGTTGRMHTSFARDTFAAEAIKLNMDFILFYDDDQILPKKMFQALMRHADKYDIIVPLIFQRVVPFKPVIYRVKYEIKDGVFRGKTEHILDYPINSIVEVDAAGTGVMLINMKVFKSVEEPFFFSNTSLGEDIWFCLQARRKGFKIACDTSIKVGHLGIPPCITELDFLKHNKEELKEIRKEEIEAIEGKNDPIVTSGIK